MNLSLCVCLSAKRRAVHCDPAGWDAARHRLRHEVPGRHELRASGPGRPQHPGQQQPRVQGVRLWPLALPGGRYVRPHLHERSGEERGGSTELLPLDPFCVSTGVRDVTLCYIPIVST